ncbi:hypothetical protein PS870_06465 [Pseudomonas fluorescens]|uniref:Lipoprotein n=1 Tax=Pseudomonas fluorescens TaxID=294 RepID=A0A5E7QJD4_PSEFL|nr:hypothetical protein [Pseudomonas fluorescens]VVP61869.1 hypothetical protein PS870_06465 [Pseudomonas fluorescens]
MMHVRRFTPHLLRALFISAIALAASGCSMAQTESFTFQADMPENFTISPMAYYASAAGESCSKHNLIQSEQPKGARAVEFKLPLTDTAKGCSMVLKKVVLNIEGQWGKRDLDMDMGTAFLSVRDEPSETTPLFPTSGPLVFQGQCQWLFRTMGPYRYIVKILQCRALDANGIVQKSLAGGALQRDQLAGKTVKLVLTMAKEEVPAVGDNWIKFPAGWKRCMGKGLDDPFAFCFGNTTDFKTFKMPDGRDCTVYPNCTE